MVEVPLDVVEVQASLGVAIDDPDNIEAVDPDFSKLIPDDLGVLEQSYLKVEQNSQRGFSFVAQEFLIFYIEALSLRHVCAQLRVFFWEHHLQKLFVAQNAVCVAVVVTDYRSDLV